MAGKSANYLYKRAAVRYKDINDSYVGSIWRTVDCSLRNIAERVLLPDNYLPGGYVLLPAHVSGSIPAETALTPVYIYRLPFHHN